ncbi:hypothetical protein PsW64_05445 [Pseudovibrio sp. W64]|jgi:hypothetical protein|uniref:Uncharacterized protein n=1 Tax=Pseudovibrio ascidiaceicola TaxID=285279 RepID=A0A1I3YRX5_9HYPH|nr:MULTISPECIES: hypothetical protein [Pseudovibrio]KZK75537.1 hypothetical protein PsW64_05445 [Pseudovibrio sp. W64]KZK86071.1 hypothetical protein PsAD13_01204 [Pseudovibrio sp. Ad13]KZK93900.1 hypothetical protein PsAD46_01150 [Pseudovibrio sp. Ad46]KZL00113.1 hypothetical protein PsAD5_01159 [Pseudovibrio sp. Ad5]KZL01236.1 hypothetical protein PsW74_02033 [Pseudovibrio sp. W74]
MQRAYRKAHRTIWLILAILIPLVLGLALLMRPTGTHEQPPVPLDDTAKSALEANQ